MAKLIFDIFRTILVFWTLKHQKPCIWDVFRAWDYARTISRSKKLLVACPKVNIGTQKNIFLIFLYVCASCLYVVCIRCVYYYIYVVVVRIICMYKCTYAYVCELCILTILTLNQLTLSLNHTLTPTLTPTLTLTINLNFCPNSDPEP